VTREKRFLFYLHTVDVHVPFFIISILHTGTQSFFKMSNESNVYNFLKPGRSVYIRDGSQSVIS